LFETIGSTRIGPSDKNLFRQPFALLCLPAYGAGFVVLHIGSIISNNYNQTWKFLLSYLLILLFVPTAVWFWIIRKELAIEHSFANCLFQVYDSKLEAFTDKRRYQILSGDLLLLSMNELIPTDVVFLTSLDHNNLYSVAT
jgi:hypothetical protein